MIDPVIEPIAKFTVKPTIANAQAILASMQAFEAVCTDQGKYLHTVVEHNANGTMSYVFYDEAPIGQEAYSLTDVDLHDLLG